MNEYIEDVIEIEESLGFSIGYGRQNPCMIISTVIMGAYSCHNLSCFLFLCSNY